MESLENTQIHKILETLSVALQMLLEVVKTHSCKLDLAHSLQAFQNPAGFGGRLSRYIVTTPQCFC